jgi:hypothetical protein
MRESSWGQTEQVKELVSVAWGKSERAIIL